MRPEDKVRQEQHGIQTVSTATETVREQDKFMLVLSYLGLFALIPLLTVKDSEFVRWHAKNGLVLGVGGGIALSIISVILGFIPVLGGLFACAAYVALLVVDIMAMVKSLRGERWRIPVVSDLADKF